MSVNSDLRFNLQNGIDKKSITVSKGLTSEVVYGSASYHNLEISPDGLPVNGSNIHVLLSVKTLEETFTIYKKDDLISLKGFTVKFNDDSGRELTTKVKSTMPDYGRGLVILICEFKRV